MKFDSKEETVEYLNILLDTGIDVDFYNLKFILQRNDIAINDIIFEDDKEKKELSLIDIRFENEMVDLVLNATSWTKYLPAIYQDNDFLKRFLFGIQTTNLTYQNFLDNSDYFLKPETTEFSDWLSSWFGVKYNTIVDEKAKKSMLYNMINLYQFRGTKRYFIELVKILTGVNISIKEYKVYNDYIHKDSSSFKNSFKVVIKEKISSDAKEEKDKLLIITEIINSEKPVNTKANIEYPYLKVNVNEHFKNSVINYHDQFENDINSTYDY